MTHTFAMTEKQILKLLPQAKEEIMRRLTPFAERVPARWVEGYADAMNVYIDEVEKTRRELTPLLDEAAHKISSLGGSGWQDDNRMVQFWLGFTHVVQTLRHNTEKGPAVVYVSPDNRLLGYAASNFLLAEMQPSAKLLTKVVGSDNRRLYNICAEPAAIAGAIGHEKIGTNSLLRKGVHWAKKHLSDNIEDVPNSEFIPLKRVPERRGDFLRRVSGLAQKDGRFNNAVLVTTTDPCGSCTRLLMDIGVSEVITDAQSHFMPMSLKRREEMAKAATRLDAHGVRHRHVHYQLNI